MRIRTTAMICVASLAASAQSPAGAAKAIHRAKAPSAADASTLLTLMQITVSEPMVKARRFVKADIPAGMTLAEFEARFPRGSEGYENFFMVAAFWETVGSLMRKGLVNEDLAFDTFLDAPPWKYAERIFKDMRARDKSPLEAINFEWIAGRAAEWVTRHERELQEHK